MAAQAIPDKVEINEKDTENYHFKQSFESWLWGSMIAATALHFMLFQFWPTRTVQDVSFTAEELEIIEIPPEIRIPPPPRTIARPATPVIATTTVDQDITIALTTFDSNPIATLPPPPTTRKKEAVDVSVAPVFTPMTVRPEIKNRTEVQKALLSQYPEMLRQAGISGIVEVWFFISEEGRVADTRIFTSSGFDEFDEAALRVANVFEFTPALNQDRLVPVWIRFPIEFRVQ